MKYTLTITIFSLLLFSSCVTDKSDNSGTIKNEVDEISVPFNDGWPAGLPKDTHEIVVFNNYPKAIDGVIRKSALENPETKNYDIDVIEVYRSRAWDGEKWYTTDNDYSALVTHNKTLKWIVGFELKNSNYVINGWYKK